MGQVAVLGGTFDPVHWGHLLVAQTALEQLNLTKVIWVPDCLPPHKQVCRYEHRWSMVEKAIADYPAFVLPPRKTERAQPNYALKTLTNLQEIYPNQQWYWIVGVDAFQTLPRWYRGEAVIPACQWLIAPRATPVTALSNQSESDQRVLDSQIHWLCQQVAQQLASQNIPVRWQLLQMPPVNISSTLIRQCCQQRRSICHLVPKAVQDHITAHNLYRE